MFSIKSNLYWSLFVTSIFFFIFLLLSSPSLNSVDDFYYLYTLAGGYGIESTNMLSYIYTLHPFLTWHLAKLFKIYPNLNWYSLFLLIIHLISCTNLLYSLKSLFHRGKKTIIFLIFFLFIECNLLLSFDYSNTSLISGISGLFSIILYYRNSIKTNYKRKSIILSIILIIISGLLRAHMLALCMFLISWIALFYLPLNKLITFFIFLFSISLLLIFCIVGQKLYYKGDSNNWQEGEQLRQSIFYSANRPIKRIEERPDSITIVKYSLIKSLFIYDSIFITKNDIKEYHKNMVRTRLKLNNEDLQILYWIIINNKIYFLFTLLFCSILAFINELRLLRRCILMSLISLILFIYLFLFHKVTQGIFLALFTIVFIAAILNLPDSINKNSKIPVLSIYVLLLFACLWMIAILEKVNSSNIRNIQQNRKALIEINKFNNFIFISVGGHFSYGDFYIWDCPINYPLNNFIFHELIHTYNYKQIFNQYNIKEVMSSLPTNNKIYLIGNQLPLFKEYYKKQGMNIEVYRANGFKYIEVYKLKSTNPF